MTDISLLLERASQTRELFEPRLIEKLHGELHKLAVRAMRHERFNHTLQPTALVNEAYLRLVGGDVISWESRSHFFATAATVMRNILVEHARSRGAGKRGGELLRVDLPGDRAYPCVQPVDFVALDIALNRLGEIDSRCLRIVELRFFAGMSIDETATLLNISSKTVKRDWEYARVWLESQLRPRPAQ